MSIASSMTKALMMMMMISELEKRAKNQIASTSCDAYECACAAFVRARAFARRRSRVRNRKDMRALYDDEFDAYDEVERCARETRDARARAGRARAERVR